MEKKWTLLPAEAQQVEALKESLKINPAICRILIQRGIDTFEKAKEFFNPGTAALHDPFLMKDMIIAVERIKEAFRKKENILIFGDYDVDGTTAVAMTYQYFSAVYDPSHLFYYVPHRYREGYGVSLNGIELAKEKGCTLIISLDCGIKSVELIGRAKEMGIDFIVCDHHLPDDTLPPAFAILNAKQDGCLYPYKELCGCGVGFKLISALSFSLGLPDETHFRYLDLVATAIAADIVPMTGENRSLATLGLQKINTNPSPGIKSLIELGGIKPPLNISNVVFVIAPRVNAAGRMDDALKAVKMFIEKDEQKALELAKMLHSDNHDRKLADSSITREALEILVADPKFESRKSSVVFHESWHKGVVGIVASRLIEHHYRPTVVLTRSGDLVTGSARSVPGFNLYEAIHACRDNLVAYGGHFAAAGLSMQPDMVDRFREDFDSVVCSTISPNLLVPEILIDAEISFLDITPSFYNTLSRFEPCGPENMFPVFLTRKVKNRGSYLIKNEHIKFSLQQENSIFSGIGFRMSEKMKILDESENIDILYCIEENIWNGNRSLQLRVIDFRATP
ncbi:MAG: single-stranded-DNA-specific exonuclease RecJ [Chitinophagaceae bacterium]|nr:single-stranded-DNA-specific exonuclease RecJ [Bacteroidota bacterium]MCC6259115.1 single-stranded-DNA-specific exonuclease RecJ [Chitinophagaceae bacterium]MCW5917696.1 single-stranded-DNA-specific exonuclease RecJ [Ferruginibacter sp.]